MQTAACLNYSGFCFN